MAMVALRTLLTVALFALASSALADTWRFPPRLKQRTFVHGAVRTVVTTDATKDQTYPRFQLEVFNSGRRVAVFPGIAVEQVFASPNNRLLVGFSNSGLPGTAVVLFTADGELLLLASHRFATFDYCHHSVTLERRWFDSENPDVQFVYEGPITEQGIFLRSCRGERIEVLRTVRQAFSRAELAR